VYVRLFSNPFLSTEINSFLFLQEHFRAWLADPAGRDQMILYQGDDLRVGWAGKTGVTDIAHERSVSLFSPFPLSLRLISTRARRNGPISSLNGHLKVPTSLRSIFKESHFGEELHSNVSTDSLTPKSNSSISHHTNATSLRGLLDPSKLPPTLAQCHLSPKKTKETTSQFGTSSLETSSGLSQWSVIQP